MPEQPGADLWALSDLCTPWCIHVAATLRIADHLAAGLTDIDSLAAAAGCDASSLHNVLGHLVSKGVFEEAVPGRFALNEVARGLLDPAQRLGLDLEGIGGRMAYAWGTLLTYVRTGRPGYHEVFQLGCSPGQATVGRQIHPGHLATAAGQRIAAHDVFTRGESLPRLWNANRRGHGRVGQHQARAPVDGLRRHVRREQAVGARLEVII
jgi:hypothetical protein